MANSTLKDISDKAGFSVATVSMVLNDRRDVSISEKTRQAVKNAADEIGYRPRSVNRLSKTIVIVTFEDLRTCFENPYFAEIYTGIEETMEKHGYHAMIKRLREGEQETLDVIRKTRIDGVLVLGAPTSFLLDNLRAQSVPTVFVNATVDSCWDSVCPDFEASFELAFKELRKHGHQKILCLKSSYYDEETPFVSKHQDHGLRNAGYSPDDLVIVKTEGNTAETGYEAMKDYLEKTPKLEVTAAVSGFSKPYGMWRAIQEAGLKIPEDFSLVAVGGDPHLSKDVEPISTVHSPLRQVGKESFLRLMQKAQGHVSSPCRIVLPVHFEDRGSVGPVPV